MAEDNYSYVRDVLNELKKGLGPYIIETFAEHFGRNQNAHLKSLKRALSSERLYRSMDFESDEDAIAKIDIAGWLKVMRLRWDTVFKEKLGEDVDSQDINVLNARSYLRELIEGRNKWGHETDENPISALDVVRIAGTATRMLRAVGWEKEANAAHNLSVEFVQTNAETIADGESETEEKNDRVDLSGLNLSDMDLRGRNLHLAKLLGVDLGGSNLHSEYLVDMDLSDVELSKSNLTGVKLSGSNLSHANLSDARLERANLENAELSRATLVKAKMSMAKISNANMSRADLTGADLSTDSNTRRNKWESALSYDYDYLEEHVGRHNVNFTNATLCRVSMLGPFLVNANFTGADLTEADIKGSRIEAPQFDSAVLDLVDLSDCHLLGCNFAGLSMHGAKLIGTTYVQTRFAHADMSGADLSCICTFFGDESDREESPWNDVNLSNASLCSAELPWIMLTNADLANAKLHDANLEHADFSGANLTSAEFRRAELSFANLSNANLMDTDFTGAELDSVNFTGAKFRYSTILPDGSYWDEDTDMTKFTGPAT